MHAAGRSTAPRLLVTLTLMATLLLLALHCEAQINFSPSWGKRSPGGSNGGGGTGPVAAAAALAGEGGPCRASVESLLYIYKLVQNEAQKLLNCEKFAE